MCDLHEEKEPHVLIKFIRGYVAKYYRYVQCSNKKTTLQL